MFFCNKRSVLFRHIPSYFLNGNTNKSYVETSLRHLIRHFGNNHQQKQILYQRDHQTVLIGIGRTSALYSTTSAWELKPLLERPMNARRE